MATTVESMASLADPRRQTDALVLLRSLYENVVTFMWLAIDPQPRVLVWYGEAIRKRRTLHLSALPYGMTVMSDQQLAEAEAAEGMKPLEQLAREVDTHWAPKLRGLHLREGPNRILTLEGLYLGVFRIASSRGAHASLEALDGWWEELPDNRCRVNRVAKDQGLQWSALAIPLFAIALTVAHATLGWPAEEEVAKINDGLMREST